MLAPPTPNPLFLCRFRLGPRGQGSATQEFIPSLLPASCLFPICPSVGSGRVQDTHGTRGFLLETPGLRSSSNPLDAVGTGRSLGHAAHVRPSRSLTLEWNNLGTWEDAFATFCGALATNSTLRQLDLRNNHISHKGAEELALALKSNTSLQQLGEALADRCLAPRSKGWQRSWGEPGRLLLCGRFLQGSFGAGPAPQVPSIW